ncbi:MAG: hypothetical protein QXK88_04730 [Desulfurococcaceae archaeon]
MDFLRHIVNPIINKHIELRTLELKEAAEVKRALYQAEEKYKFSIYNGEPSNLIHFLNSEDFETLVELFKSSSALNVLVEILERAGEVYKENRSLYETIKSALSLIKGGDQSGERAQTLPPVGEDLGKLGSYLESLGARRVVVGGNTLRATVSDDLELKISVLKKSIKLELKLARPQEKELLLANLKKAESLLEKISSNLAGRNYKVSSDK